MKTQTDTKEQQNTTAPKVQQESNTGGTATIEDNRPSTIYQRKLRATMNTSVANNAHPIQRKTNKTGLPDNLKSGIENLSGYSMDDVKVHYNSNKPAQLHAHAYAQGTDIHLAPRQEKQLPHEAWHVVQQKQGRVQPTRQLKSKININDDSGLEKEADIMGEKASKVTKANQGGGSVTAQLSSTEGAMVQKKAIQNTNTKVVQRKRKSDRAKVGIEIETTLPVRKIKNITDQDKARQTEMLNKEYGSAEEQQEAINLYEGIQEDFDPGYKRLVHTGNGWKAEVDHVKVLRDLFKLKILPIDSAVEIVTDPVNTFEQAKLIIDDVNLWINNTVLAGIKANANNTYVEGNYIYEIPNEGKYRILSRGQLWGNIQYNVGAELEDVVEVFKENLDTIKGDDKIIQEGIIDTFGGDEFWDSVVTNFNNANTNDQDIIREEDAQYLKAIMFMYLYTAASTHLMPGNETSKNQYPVLSKTPVKKQVALSGWGNKRLWTGLNYFNPTNWGKSGYGKSFRRKFFNAISLSLMTSTSFKLKNKEGKDFTDEEKQYLIDFISQMIDNKEHSVVANKIEKKEDLKIAPKRYAGVFELRGSQNSPVKQGEWLDKWAEFLPDPMEDAL